MVLLVLRCADRTTALPLPPAPTTNPQATKFRGLAFIATQDFFGAEKARLPSIFWAIVDPSPRLCSPSLESWGLLASADGLALATPIITGRSECGAFLAFSYGGNTTIKLNGQPYPAYAGACRQSNSSSLLPLGFNVWGSSTSIAVCPTSSANGCPAGQMARVLPQARPYTHRPHCHLSERSHTGPRRCHPGYLCLTGAAKAVVGCEGAREEITVVKRGEGLVNRPDTRPDPQSPQRCGYYSAWDSLDGMIWTAVPVALDTDLQYGSWISTERC